MADAEGDPRDPQPSGSRPEATEQYAGSNHNTSQPSLGMPQQGVSQQDEGGIKHSELVRLRPPPPEARPKRGFSRSITLKLGATTFSRTKTGDLYSCARLSAQHMSVIEWRHNPTISYQGMKFRPEMTRTTGQEFQWNHRGPYIIVGIMGNTESVPREVLLSLSESEKDLFRQVRWAERRLRHPLRRLISLKRVGAFGLYQCHPNDDYHSSPELGSETQRSLAEFYRDYRTEKYDNGERWKKWVQVNFNGSSQDPKNGTYALQLLLRWSPIKLIMWSSIPILLSLAVGFWYMLNPNPGEDHVAVVQTAWTIASYIVTTAALALAIVAAVTQLGDI